MSNVEKSDVRDSGAYSTKFAVLRYKEYLNYN